MSSQYSQFSVVLVFGLIVVIAIAYLIITNRIVKRDRKAIYDEIDATVKKHLPALLKRRLQLVRYDAYGKMLVDDWLQEIFLLHRHPTRPSTQ